MITDCFFTNTFLQVDFGAFLVSPDSLSCCQGQCGQKYSDVATSKINQPVTPSDSRLDL